MLEFKEKKKVRRMIYSMPVLFLLAAVFLLSVEGLWNIYGKYTEASQKASEATVDLERLRDKEAELEKKVAFLKTDRGKEEEIRKKFMVGKEGEGVILVVDQGVSTTPPAPVPEPSAWARFLNFFR